MTTAIDPERTKRMYAIEQEAREAAHAGKLPNDGCPYPFGTEDATHWLACWILEGGGLAAMTRI